MKSITPVVNLVGIFILCAATALAKEEIEEPVKINQSYVLATATPGGTFYPVGVAIATLVNVKLQAKHGITMTAISSAGSGENINLLNSGHAQFAILQGFYGSMAWKGEGVFKEVGPQKDIRSITMLWRNVEHFTVHKSKVKTGNIDDLANFNKEPFSIGEKNSGTQGSGRYILVQLGIDPESVFDVRQYRYSTSAAKLINNSDKNKKEDSIKGMNTPGGIPVEAVKKAFRNNDNLKILEVTDEQLAVINEKHDLWQRHIIPAGTYIGQNTAVKTISQPNVLVAHKDTDARAVQLITETIYENLEYFRQIHNATKVMNKNNAVVGMPMPLHPGAINYYKEANEVEASIPKHLLQ